MKKLNLIGIHTMLGFGISNNHSGVAFLTIILSCLNLFVEEKIFFDELLFCETLQLNNFDLIKLFDLMKTGEYIPDMKSIEVKHNEQDIQYAGCNFKCHAIYEKI